METVKNLFLEKHNIFWFLGLWKFLLECKKFLKLGARKFPFLECIFLQELFFEMYFLKRIIYLVHTF